MGRTSPRAVYTYAASQAQPAFGGALLREWHRRPNWVAREDSSRFTHAADFQGSMHLSVQASSASATFSLRARFFPRPLRV